MSTELLETCREFK